MPVKALDLKVGDKIRLNTTPRGSENSYGIPVGAVGVVERVASTNSVDVRFKGKVGCNHKENGTINLANSMSLLRFEKVVELEDNPFIVRSEPKPVPPILEVLFPETRDGNRARLRLSMSGAGSSTYRTAVYVSERGVSADHLGPATLRLLAAALGEFADVVENRK